MVTVPAEVKLPDPEYVPEGLMTMLPADAFPATLKLPPVTVSVPVAEILGAKLMFVVVVLRPTVMEREATGNWNLSNIRSKLVCASLKSAVD